MYCVIYCVFLSNGLSYDKCCHFALGLTMDCGGGINLMMGMCPNAEWMMTRSSKINALGEIIPARYGQTIILEQFRQAVSRIGD